MKRKLNLGDIFYLKLNNVEKYVFGRLLFDADKQYHKIVDVNKLSNDYFPYLRMFHNGCQLVELYDGIYDKIDDFDSLKILLPHVFTKNIDSKSNILNWGILHNKLVDYKK